MADSEDYPLPCHASFSWVLEINEWVDTNEYVIIVECDRERRLSACCLLALYETPETQSSKHVNFHSGTSFYRFKLLTNMGIITWVVFLYYEFFKLNFRLDFFLNFGEIYFKKFSVLYLQFLKVIFKNFVTFFHWFEIFIPFLNSIS